MIIISYESKNEELKIFGIELATINMYFEE